MDKLREALTAKDEIGFQTELERRIALLKADMNTSNVAAHNAEVTALLTVLRQGKGLIPAYSLKRYTEDIEEAKISKGPMSFSFGRKAEMKRAVDMTKNKEEQTEGQEERIEYAIHDLENQTLEHVADGGVVKIGRLENCKILIPNETGGISCSSLKNCIVIAEHLTGSAMIKDCDNCTFALKMKQLRIHNTTASDFYISVIGNPIIEHCERVRFAPLKGLESGPWNDVKDFDCPTTCDVSPNWCVIPDQDVKIPTF
jgi:hypothetical protein